MNRRGTLAAAALAALVGISPGPIYASAPNQVGTVPSGAQKIIDKEAYRTARWTYHVTDLKSGDVLLSNRSEELVLSGSTAKNYTVGAAYDILGPDSRLTTPVYATTPVVDGEVDGDLVLVASGDLALGGRNALQGRFDQSFTATTIDHVYGDLAPNAVKPPGEPLAGVDNLAAQVAASGVTRISGDVVIDDRLWETEVGHEAAVPPIYVNDNILDIPVTPAVGGTIAAASANPVTAAYSVVSTVTTQDGSDSVLSAAADPTDPHRVIVSGTIGSDAGPRLTIYRVPDPAGWARTLLIEALGRAGVAVAAEPIAPNQTAGLPTRRSYDPQLQLASLKSPPLSAFGAMILETSYNTGANAVLCLLAAHAGSATCADGLKAMRPVLNRAGLAEDAVVLTDGEGAYPASTTPEQMVRWLTWTQSQTWGATFKAGQPVLGESGTLAAAGLDSAARGKVDAKTGTIAAIDPSTGRMLFNVQSMAGFMQTNDGRTLVFDVSMSGGTYPDVPTGLTQSTNDVGEVAAQFQQALSR
jgi:serine-type D-Ala-D-Ala carboxypeptidase/endopeptidase (penicillin-binding protein 4)